MTQKTIDYSEMHRKMVKKQPRADGGRFGKKIEVSIADALGSSRNVPPLVSLEVSNPITYLKLWWQRVMANEGIDVRFRIHPLTALALMGAFAIGGFGLGRISMPIPAPIIKYIPQWAPTPTPDPWRETGYSGVLQKSGLRWYLVTNDAEAITLEILTNVDLTKYVGKRIFVTGRYNRMTQVLQVTEAADMEVLIQSVVIPTTVPSSTPTEPPLAL